MLLDRFPSLTEAAMADAPPAGDSPPAATETPPADAIPSLVWRVRAADAQRLLKVPQALTVGQYSEVGHSVQVSATAGSTVVCCLTF
jgi:hypothetical protein